MATIPAITHQHTTSDGHTFPVICTCDNRDPEDILPFIEYVFNRNIKQVCWVHHHKGNLQVGVCPHLITLCEADRAAELWIRCEGGNTASIFDGHKYGATGEYYDYHLAFVTH